MYFPSRKASLGNSCGAAMLRLVCAASSVRTEYCVTSLPVPAVVGMWIMGRTSPPIGWVKMSPTSCRAHKATALAASIGEPPPAATMKSAPNERASAAHSRTVATDGLASTRS